MHWSEGCGCESSTSDLRLTVMIMSWPQGFMSKCWWPCMYFVETWLSMIWGRCLSDSAAVRVSLKLYVKSAAHILCNVPLKKLVQWLYIYMGTCPFPLQSPLLASPRALPAIFRANLKLRYYESCTWCVGGRLRTSTPSINPLMGPTSWLNRPVPPPDNLSSAEAKLRSCNYTQTFFLPLLKSSFDDFLTRPFSHLLLEKAWRVSQQPLYQKLHYCVCSVAIYEGNWMLIVSHRTRLS